VVLAFRDAAAAQRQLRSLAAVWRQCGGSTMTLTAGKLKPVSVSMSVPNEDNGITTMVAEVQGPSTSPTTSSTRSPGEHAATATLARGRLPVMELALQITLVVTSVLVVLLVLLHRAKGGGLSTLFGGGVQSSLSGSTVVEKNLDRLTLFIVGIWLVSIVGIALQIKYR
jgi:preprotein translocase subunit SecG